MGAHSPAAERRLTWWDNMVIYKYFDSARAICGLEGTHFQINHHPWQVQSPASWEAALTSNPTYRPWKM